MHIGAAPQSGPVHTTPILLNYKPALIAYEVDAIGLFVTTTCTVATIPAILVSVAGLERCVCERIDNLRAAIVHLISNTADNSRPHVNSQALKIMPEEIETANAAFFSTLTTRSDAWHVPDAVSTHPLLLCAQCSYMRSPIVSRRTSHYLCKSLSHCNDPPALSLLASMFQCLCLSNTTCTAGVTTWLLQSAPFHHRLQDNFV